MRDARQSAGRQSRPGARSIRFARLRKTLGEHYRQKREHYGLDHPDFYDSDLRNLFSDAPAVREDTRPRRASSGASAGRCA